MNKLTPKLRKLKVTPVTGKEPETEVEQKWCDIAKITKDKIGYMKPTDIKMELTDPQLLNPILDRAPKKEVPAILVKIIQDIDKGRLMGKRLALNITRRRADLASQPQSEAVPSFPVSTLTKKRLLYWQN